MSNFKLLKVFETIFNNLPIINKQTHSFNLGTNRRVQSKEEEMSWNPRQEGGVGVEGSKRGHWIGLEMWFHFKNRTEQKKKRERERESNMGCDAFPRAKPMEWNWKTDDSE